MIDTHVAREEALLGCLLLDNAQLRRIEVSAADFVSATHRQMFEAIRRMVSAGKVTDALTVAETLEAETGRREWLSPMARMVQETLAPVNAPAYAQAIRKASIARQAKAAAVALAQDVDGDGNAAIDAAIKALMDLTKVQADHVCHQFEAMQTAIDEMAAREGRLPGIRSGMRDLDESLGGFHAEDLIVVGARPAMGKTAFMLNVASAANCPVGIISGEQGRAQVGMRFLAIDGGISLHSMRTGKLESGEWERVTKALGTAKDKPVWINDKPAPTIEDVVRQARVWKFDRNIGLLMVDYLQKLRGGSGENFRLQVGDITTQLKDLARELKIPVVALAQVKREVESRNVGSDGMGRMPFMSDLAEAAIIEQEADQIITLYRPEVYDDRPQFKGLAYANICKNRHGPVGHKEIAWRGEFLQFGDLAKSEMAYQDRWSRTD